MKQIRQHHDEQEPMGIVISGGARHEVMPRFVAYVWGPAPEPAVPEENTEPRAA